MDFNLVMPADPDAAPADYRERVSAIAQLAHANSVAVEAEIGELPSGIPGEEDHAGSETSAEDAKAFVAETGIDLLAVSVGNVHIALNGAHRLDLVRLADIHAAVDVPLVLHGGTGIAPDHLVKAISLGVTKVNYGTYIKQRYLEAVRIAINSDEPNPHALIGLGGPQDILVVGRKAVREAVLGAATPAQFGGKSLTMPRIGCAGILVADTFCGPMRALPKAGELPCHRRNGVERGRMRRQCGH